MATDPNAPYLLKVELEFIRNLKSQDEIVSYSKRIADFIDDFELIAEAKIDVAVTVNGTRVSLKGL